MTETDQHKRLFLLGNPDKPEVPAAMERLHSFARKHCDIIGAKLSTDGQVALEAGAEMIVVFGGDGTMLGVARSLGRNQIPLVGVNFGKLGYLADYLLEEMQFNFDRVLNDPSLISDRMMLDMTVHRGGYQVFSSMAVNDCVIQAGPPFRIIELSVSLDDRRLTDVGGEGLIVSTPSGSTAFNLSAGGPIVQPGLHAFVLTPLLVHSLTHRPMVLEQDAVVEVVAKRVNHGTAVIVDGQMSCGLRPDDRVVVRRSQTTFKLVHNPMYPRWHKLVDKLGWGQALKE
ncbi:MAG: NAD(+)/NADH kinase [Phycisphaerae bacterium]|nr:NAD(+)/NADH kinase [Phycisphaerae bacterium]